MYVVAGSDIHPLYPGATISKEASWLSIYHYAISNRLTDAAMKELIELIKVHIPSLTKKMLWQYECCDYSAFLFKLPTRGGKKNAQEMLAKR